MGNNLSGMQKEFWDFDENNNYTSYKLCGETFKVLKKYPDSLRAAMLLSNIKNFINSFIISIGRANPIPESMINRIELLKYTDFHVQEMQIDTSEEPVPFEGLNKPKDIIQTSGPIIGPDTTLRAKKRLIFLKLRWNNGTLKTMGQLEKLIIHEITHTACNHVTYRDEGNHAKDFKKCEQYLTDVKKKLRYK